MTTGEFLNVSALDPLLPTFLIATLCLCALPVITYYSLAIAWEVFWASRRSPSPLDPSAEVVLTVTMVDPRWSVHSLGYQTQPNMVCVHSSYAMTDKYASPFLTDSLS